MWEALKKLDHYGRSVLVALPVALGLLILLIQAQSPSLLLDNAFLDFITIPIFVGNIVANSTYFARLFDFSKNDFPVNDNDPAKPSRKRERIGTVFGVLLGIAAGIALALSNAPIPFAPTLCTLANILFVVNRMSVFAGLGARIGSCADTARPAGERYGMGFASIVGFGLGITLFLTSSTTAVTTAGITTVLTGGLALPLWISGFIFVGTFTSLVASFADYTSKAITFLSERYKANPTGEMIRNKRFHEYRGSYLGTILGFAIGSAAVFLLQPQLAGFASIIAAALIVTTAVTALGGLFSRVGRLGDGLFPHINAGSTGAIYEKLQQNEPTAGPQVEPKPANSSANDDQAALNHPSITEPSGTPANTGMYKPAPPNQPPATPPSAAPAPLAAPSAVLA